MGNPTHSPTLKKNFVDVLGQIIGALTAMAALFIPLIVLTILTKDVSLGIKRVTTPHYLLALFYVSISLLFLFPQLTAKGFRSRDSLIGKFFIRLVLFIVFLIIAAPIFAFVMSNGGFMARFPDFRSTYYIYPLAIGTAVWIFLYFQFFVIPGYYIGRINVRRRLSMIDLPVPMKVEIKRRKQFGEGLVSIDGPAPFWIRIVTLPFLALLFAGMYGMLVANFFPSADLVEFSQEYRLYTTVGAAIVFVPATFVLKTKSRYRILNSKIRQAFVAVIMTTGTVYVFWPYAINRAMPELHSFATGGNLSTQDLVVVEVSPVPLQPFCKNPIRVAFEDSPELGVQLLCNINYKFRAQLKPNEIIRLRGMKTRFGIRYNSATIVGSGG